MIILLLNEMGLVQCTDWFWLAYLMCPRIAGMLDSLACPELLWDIQI